MIRALFLAFDDLGDRRILAILVRSLLVTLLVFALLGVALGFLLKGFDPCGLVSSDDSCPLGGSTSGFGAFSRNKAMVASDAPAVRSRFSASPVNGNDTPHVVQILPASL